MAVCCCGMTFKISWQVPDVSRGGYEPTMISVLVGTSPHDLQIHPSIWGNHHGEIDAGWLIRRESPWFFSPRNNPWLRILLQWLDQPPWFLIANQTDIWLCVKIRYPITQTQVLMLENLRSGLPPGAALVLRKSRKGTAMASSKPTRTGGSEDDWCPQQRSLDDELSTRGFPCGNRAVDQGMCQWWKCLTIQYWPTNNG